MPVMSLQSPHTQWILQHERHTTDSAGCHHWRESAMDGILHGVMCLAEVKANKMIIDYHVKHIGIRFMR